MSNSSKWIVALIVVVILLAGYEWYSISSKRAELNGQYDPNNTPAPSQSSGQPQASQSSLVPSLQAPVVSVKPTKNLMHKITIETNKGTIVFETYDKDAPLASANFVNLAKAGFYSNTIFHRVIKGFMIQGGDPTGTGRGGPGYQFADELDSKTPSYKAGYVRGTVAMANAGPNTNGSQFFIMHQDYPLPHDYTIFGKVISGMETVDAIASTKTNEGDRPVEDIVMKKVTVEEL